MRGCSCCGSQASRTYRVAEQAKILVAEAVENNLDLQPSWNRWHVRPVRATIPRRRAVRTRLGVLEDDVGRPEMDVLGNVR